MPQWVVGKVAEALNDCGKALKGAKVQVLCIACKQNDHQLKLVGLRWAQRTESPPKLRPALQDEQPERL